MRIKAIIFTLLAMLLIQACSSSSVYVPVTRPAEINLKGFEKIAIGELRGRGSNQLTDELTIALFESGRFEVLNRQHLGRIMREHSLSLSGVVDPETATEIGRLIGAAALIFGTVNEHDYHEELSHEDRENKKTGETVRHYTREGEAKVTATLQVVDLKTGKIIAISKLNDSEKATERSSGEQPERIDRNELLQACRAKVVTQFVRKIAPYTERVSVSFELDDKMPELEQGYNMVKIDNWDEAISIFRQAVERYRSTSLEVNKAYYDLGIAYMYTEQFDAAREHLELAFKHKGDSKYQRAIEQLNKRIADRKKLQEQL